MDTQGVMLSAVLLGLLLAAPRGNTCPPLVAVSGEDTDAVQVLGEHLMRAGIVPLGNGRVPENCAPLFVHIEGRQPPYLLRVRDARAVERTWRVHRVEMATAMVESALDTIAPPPPHVDPFRVVGNLAVRSEVALDSLGVVYAGPAVQLSGCSGVVCLDLLARFGVNMAGDVIAGARHDVAVTLGPSVSLGDDEAAFQTGIALGARWSQVRVAALADSLIDWSNDGWPFEDLDEAALLFAWELRVGGYATLTEGLVFDGQLSLQLLPEGELRGISGLPFSSDLVVRMGVGIRWGLPG
jgi:hypothetical protein